MRYNSAKNKVSSLLTTLVPCDRVAAFCTAIVAGKGTATSIREPVRHDDIYIHDINSKIVTIVYHLHPLLPICTLSLPSVSSDLREDSDLRRASMTNPRLCWFRACYTLSHKAADLMGHVVVFLCSYLKSKWKVLCTSLRSSDENLDSMSAEGIWTHRPSINFVSRSGSGARIEVHFYLSHGSPP